MEAVSIAGKLRVTRIIWLGLFVATFLFASVLLQLRTQGQAPSTPQLATPIVAAIGSVGLVVALVSLLMPPRILAMAVRNKQPTVTEAMGGRAVAEPVAAVHTAFPPYQTSMLLGMSLAESVALIGFALGYMGEPASVVLPFFGVCWVLMAWKYPRVTLVTDAIERVTGARCTL